MNNKILIIDKTHPILVEKLNNNAFACVDFTGNSYEELSAIIHNYIGIIIRSRFSIDRNLIDKATNLKFIGRVGAGLESIDLEYAESKNINCINSPEGNMDAVGEHAVAMLLNLYNRINIANQEVKLGEWNREENRGMELSGKTVGIIGYGNMGSAFAKKLSGFNCKVISYDKYKHNYSDEYTQESSLDDIFSNADIISFHVPFTEETHYYFDGDFINSFAKNILILNTARGKVVKTSSLVKALESGKVIGAGLDVLEYEKSSFEGLANKTNLPADLVYLLNAENVIITPHIAGWTHESKIKLAEILADKIISL